MAQSTVGTAFSTHHVTLMSRVWSPGPELLSLTSPISPSPPSRPVSPSAPMPYARATGDRNRLSRSELLTTDTDEDAMAAPASIGLIRIPAIG